MTKLSYVRSEMAPEKAPPVTQTGIIKWMRENLFSSVLNSILTLAAIWLIYSLLAATLPWVFHSSWAATSLDGCRKAIRAAYGSDASGACWAVIRDRYNQLLFGFYPADLYWRPELALALMLVAIAPILFEAAPRKMLWFSGLYPFVAFFLLWGGTIFVPLAVIFGFVISVLAMVYLPRFIGQLAAVTAAILLPLIWWLFLTNPTVDLVNRMLAGPMTPSFISKMEGEIARNQAIKVDPNVDKAQIDAAEGQVKRYTRQIANARKLPKLEASIAKLSAQAKAKHGALTSAFQKYQSVEEIPDSVGKNDKAKIEDALKARREFEQAKKSVRLIYSEVGRIGLRPVESAKFGGFMLSIVIGVTGIALSLPLGVLLALGRQSNLFVMKSLSVGFIEFIRGVPLITLLFVASTLLNYFMPPGTNFDIILRVMIMVTLFSSAYMAEVIRGGLAALPRGQYEAADALGLDYWKSMRLIVMPQALKISIPSIVGIFIGLFKDTTLVSIIGLMDPLGLSNAIRADASWNGIVWELYAFIAFMFFIFCFAMGRYSMYLERKLETGHH